MFTKLKRIFHRKPAPIEPSEAALEQQQRSAAKAAETEAKKPPEEIGIFTVGDTITINGLSFRVLRFGAHELHLLLEGRGKLVWRKRAARRAKAKKR